MYVTNLFFGLVGLSGGRTERADNFILPVRKPLAEVLDSVGMYLEARLLCKHMHFVEAAGTAFGVEGLLYKERTDSVLFRIDRHQTTF